MTANIRTSQRTVSAMQRFAVSQKNRAEATTISPFSLSLPYRTENRRFSALSCAKTGSTQPKLSAACFVVQSCLADADFVVFSNYCLIGTRHMPSASGVYICSAILCLQAAQHCHQNGVILAVRGVGAAGDDDRAGRAANGAGHGLPCNVGAGLVQHVADLDERHQ